MEKKRKPVVLSVVFSVFICMLPFVANAFLMGNQNLENALRLTIRYENEQMTLIKVEKLRMIIPITVKERILKKGDYSTEKYYFELHDNKMNLLFRSSMEDPTLTVMEYEDPESSGKIISSVLNHENITFSIIISEIDQVRFIKFTRVVSGQKIVKHEMKKYEDLGTFDLIKVRKNISKYN